MEGARKEILILDQDENVLVELERLLQDEGFETTTTWNITEALHLLAVKQFDLVLISDQLAEASCSELLKMLASARTGSIPILVQTGDASRLQAQHLSPLAVYAVIPKWKHRDLVSRIKECLNRSENSPRKQATAA